MPWSFLSVGRLEKSMSYRHFRRHVSELRANYNNCKKCFAKVTGISQGDNGCLVALGFEEALRFNGGHAART
jgi:hypothetical protein